VLILDKEGVKMDIFSRHSFCEYSDLACERGRFDISEDGVEYSKAEATVGTWERIKITSDKGAESIGRPVGIYNTLHLDRMDRMDSEAAALAVNEIAEEIRSVAGYMNAPCKRILAVGLGNGRLTPDAIGPESADQINATMHIRAQSEDTFLSLGCSEIAVIKPGVSADSGMDAVDTVRGVCKCISPDLVIAIDALAAGAVSRLGATVQLSSTGILPGGGIGAPRCAINESTVSVPVLAIGVPTVINSRAFQNECCYQSDEEHMLVSPKNINSIVAISAKIIGTAINRAFGIEL
jgi:spore protease